MVCSPAARAHAAGTGASSTGSPRRFSSRGNVRVSQVPGEPQCARALFSDPGGRRYAKPVAALSCCLASLNSHGSHEYISFEAQSHGSRARCLRFEGHSCLRPTQDSLPAGGQPLPGGIGYPPGSSRGFQVIYITILLAQALPGAIRNRSRTRSHPKAWRCSAPRSRCRGPRTARPRSCLAR